MPKYFTRASVVSRTPSRRIPHECCRQSPSSLSAYPVAIPTTPNLLFEAGNYRRIPVSLSEHLDNGSPETLSLWKLKVASSVGYKAIRRPVVCLYEPVCRAM